MILAVPKEVDPKESRAAIIPGDVERLVAKGADVHVELGLGTSLRLGDDAYSQAGATVRSQRGDLLQEADVVLRVRKPSLDEVALLREGSVHISLLDPFNAGDLIDSLRQRRVSAISMELLPRTTRAQKMDVLSSQASLAGYVTVILAAERLDKVFPMMMTPAGTLSPARVFVIGAGVAGLQAIATAKRLGARVEAFDVRPEAAEQIESLGAKAVHIDIGQTEATKDGYAKQLTPEQLELQRLGIAKICAQSDVVITTANVFGRKAPLIITADMVQAMKNGSVLVDLAVESGGNVEGSRPDEEVEIEGVRILGLANLPGRVAEHASQMYSANLRNLVEEYWNQETRALELDLDDDLLRGCLVTHEGEIISERLKSLSG